MVTLFAKDSAEVNNPITQEHYITVGGVGGSGTRLVANLLMRGGVQLGGDLNVSNDTLTYTLLFKDRSILTAPDDNFNKRVSILLRYLNGLQISLDDISFADVLSRVSRSQHPTEWLLERVNQLSSPWRTSSKTLLGWKEPNTHMVLERLLSSLPNMKYIHVVRHGVDMAFSSNQNQLKFWSLDDPFSEVTPQQSFEWWCRVQTKVSTLIKSHPTRIYILRFEDLLLTPRKIVESLFNFCNIVASQDDLNDIVHLVQPNLVTQRNEKYTGLHISNQQEQLLRDFEYKVK